jgi:hypothetical protein
MPAYIVIQINVINGQGWSWYRDVRPFVSRIRKAKQ